MKRLLSALAALAVLSPLPASAATTQSVCVRALTAAANGDVYGAGDCSDAVTVYRRAASSGSFRAVATAWKGFDVADVADDGSSTFVLLHCQGLGGTCQASDPLVGRFAAATLPHGGRPSAITLLGDGQGGGGSIAAAGGRWAAAYAAAEFRREESDRAYSRIELRGTGVPGGRALLRPDSPDATPEPYVTDPSVALTPGGPVFAYLARKSDSDPAPELRTATVGADGRVTTSAFTPAAGAPAGPPALTVSGGRTFVAWARGGRLALAHDGVRQDLPTRGTVGDVRLAASGGTAFVLDGERFAYTGSTTSRTYLRAVSLDGAVTTTELSAAAGRRNPHVSSGPYDVTAAQGRATSAFYVDAPGAASTYVTSP